jgi:phosphoribosylanthranilate isomerase
MLRVAGNVGRRGRVPGRTGGSDRCRPGGLPSRGMSGQCELANLCDFHFVARPGPGRCDGLPGAVILRIMSLKIGENLLGAIRRPERQQSMFFIVHFFCHIDSCDLYKVSHYYINSIMDMKQTSESNNERPDPNLVRFHFVPAPHLTRDGEADWHVLYCFQNMKTRVKICCIASEDEAKLAISFGASALGLVAAMPSGPGPIADYQIRCIARLVPPPIATFLLTCQTRGGAIIAHHLRTLTSTIQLVDTPEEDAIDTIRAVLPAVKIVQVIHVCGEAQIDEALQAAAQVDALLLDSGNPSLAVKELGGTGRVHDWRLSCRIVERSPVPVFLAGGLHAANVREAIDQVQPFGVDLCSGVRTHGRLDPKKLEAFFNAVWK